MTKKKKRLGRGLDALLTSTSPAENTVAESNATGSLPIEQLQPGEYQPRTRMDEESLQELAASIKSQGIIQPILVRPVVGGRYEIIAGERRWRASTAAGLKQVPVIIRNLSDLETLEISIVENELLIIRVRVLIDVIYSLRIERRCASFETVHLIAFFQ